MGLMTRLLRLWKADLHGVMDQLEDKELLLKQYLREMENDLLDKKRGLDQLDAKIEQIKHTLAGRKKELEAMESDLTLAVEKDKTDIARMVIRKRIALQSTCRHLEHQCSSLESDREKQATILIEQNARYDELKIRVTTFLQRSGSRPSALSASEVRRNQGWL